MPYLNTVIDWFLENWEFECGENNQQVYEEMEDEWNPSNRFSIADLLREDLSGFLEWIQERIDEECEDTTETITFPPERIDRDEEIKEEILDTEIELLTARKELLEVKIAELESARGGVFEGIKRFIRNIFGG